MLSPRLHALSTFHRQAGAVTVWSGKLHPDQWIIAAQIIQDQGGRLLALWGEDQLDETTEYRVYAAFLSESGIVLTYLSIEPHLLEFPTLTDIFPAAQRMERALYDFLGLRAIGNNDQRAWLRHGSWAEHQFPLRKDFCTNDLSEDEESHYPFHTQKSPEGHEIPVGPVHAGIIEPGHFRFQVLGEEILRMEERFGYAHKGIERLFQGQEVVAGGRLAGRVSGDNTVAYAWAFAQAVEQIAQVVVPERAQWLRALCLERERIANHLGDLGAIGNDAGLAFALTQFQSLKEDWLRDHLRYFGHRYLMDRVRPGGVAFDLEPEAVTTLRQSGQLLQEHVDRLQVILSEHGGLRDRVVNTGIISAGRAAHQGLMGVVGRASNQPWDLRVQFPSCPYDQLNVRLAQSTDGDVAARMSIRFMEIAESLRLQKEILDHLPEGHIEIGLDIESVSGTGIGWVEGWRGEVVMWLRVNHGHISRCHPHDPSWTLWPALEEAVLQDIVADFPLINKSFNLSYSGHDL